MRVLLLTKNHVAREFVELACDKVSANLMTVKDINSIKKYSYEFIFIDAAAGMLSSFDGIREYFDGATTVVLYSQENSDHQTFDIKLKKPFLPSDIQSILEYDHCEHEEAKKYMTEDQILDLNEIDRIKDLLEDEGMEIVLEHDLVDEIDGESFFCDEKETKKGENMQNKLLKALLDMGPKKIRKLLRGAEVTITIRFPKNEK